MKRKSMFLLLFLTICLSGCADSSEEFGQSTVVDVQQLLLGEDLNNESGETTHLEEQPDIATQAMEQVPVNTTDETVAIKWNGERLSRAAASVGTKMYFSQWAGEERSPVLYEMSIGEDSLLESRVEIPEGMDVKAMAEDSTGGLHLLLRSSSKNSEAFASLIRELDREGNMIQDVDISEAIKDRYVLTQAFFVDSKGNYYIKDLDNMICISNDGISLWEMNNRSLGINRSYAAAAVGDSVYMSYQKNETTYIGEVNPTDGGLEAEYPLPKIAAEDPIMVMEQGTDSDLLLYGSGSGIWAWNRNGSEPEKRADISEAGLSYNETIVARIFLKDGRLLLVKNVSEGNELAGITYQYISGGR